MPTPKRKFNLLGDPLIFGEHLANCELLEKKDHQFLRKVFRYYLEKSAEKAIRCKIKLLK